MKKPINYLVIIQARLGSTRFPGKVLQTVNGRTLVKRIWDAAKGSKADKVIVAWPERYPDLDQNDVRERFRRISREFPSRFIVRLTADCPLLTPYIIDQAIERFEERLAFHPGTRYYNNREIYPDGFDVQIFTAHVLHGSYTTDKEHVITPHPHKTPDKFLSVDTKEDLERVKEWAKHEK